MNPNVITVMAYEDVAIAQFAYLKWAARKGSMDFLASTSLAQKAAGERTFYVSVGKT